MGITYKHCGWDFIVIYAGFIYKLKQFPTALQRNLPESFPKINFHDIRRFHISGFIDVLLEPQNAKGCT